MPSSEGGIGCGSTTASEKTTSKWLGPTSLPTEILPIDVGTPDEWVPRDPGLIRLTGKHPFNAEPPSDKMLGAGFITPPGLHFVRSHGRVPKLEWETHSFKVQGLVGQERIFTMEELASLPTTTLPVTIVCAGNRRSELNRVKQTTGFNFGSSAHGCNYWTGVRLADLLRMCDVDLTKAKHVEFVGGTGEDLPQGTYGSSIPISLAMDMYADVLIAFKHNGLDLTPDHGFPVRAIIPGWVAGRSVKWLQEINVTTESSQNYYFFNDNRILPPHVDAKLAKAEGWCQKPEYLYNEITINSAISYPYNGETMVLNDGKYTLKGYAYSGGGRRVNRVELSFDGGLTWRLCVLDHPEERHSVAPSNGRYWCWMFWEYTVKKHELLECAVKSGSIRVRAWDSSNNTQPDSLTWNLMGMGNNCHYSIKVQPGPAANQKSGSPFTLVFLHPTVPGPAKGGWMMPLKKELADKMEPAKEKSTVDKKKTFSKSEVASHASEDSCSIIFEESVYDVTAYLKHHPGGIASILLNGGEDSTEDFLAIHSEKARNMLEGYYIGDLADPAEVSNEVGWQTASLLTKASDRISKNELQTHRQALTVLRDFENDEVPVALNPKEWQKFKLLEKIEISHDTRLLRFELPTPRHKLGLPVGYHMLAQAPHDGKVVVRAYTPVSSDDDRGSFTLCVKVYFGGRNRKFPYGGLLSQFLEVLAVGDHLKIKGPLGRLEYTGRGCFSLSGSPRQTKRFGLICGGTGLTPAYQVMRAIFTDENDTTEVHLLYANRAPDDILLREELDQMSEARPEQIKIWYTVDTAPDGWKYSTGFIGEEMLRKHMPSPSEDSFVAMCGPPAMVERACIPNLKNIGFSDDQFMCF